VGTIDDRNGPDLLLQMNQNGELPLLLSPPISVAGTAMITETQKLQNDIHHSTTTSHNENVIVSECYDEEYPVPDVPTSNPPIVDDMLLQKQNPAIAIIPPILPSFPPPLSSMGSRHISNITDPTSLGSEHAARSTVPMVSNKKNHALMDRGSPLRVATSNSQDFDSEGFMLNPTNSSHNNNNNNELSYHSQHQPPMIGTPSRYGVVTTAIPSTVSDLDINETPLMSDFQDSPLPTFQREDNNIAASSIGGYDGEGGSNHGNNNNDNNIDTDYTHPSLPLIMGLSIPGTGIEYNQLDHHYHQQQQHHYYQHQYPHEPESFLQQDNNIYQQSGTSIHEENRSMPLMTGFQLEIQDLE
jgi:hypothetical protein